MSDLLQKYAFTSDLLEQFITEKRFTYKTSEELRRAVSSICFALEREFTDIDGRGAMGYYNSMVSDNLKASTVRSRLSRFRSFARFIQENELVPGYVNPFQMITFKDEGLNNTVSKKMTTIHEFDALLSAASEDLMAYLIFTLAFRCALSVADIVDLKLSYLSLSAEGMCLSFPQTRYHCAHTVRLPSDVAELIQNYISQVNYFDEEGHLFYNKWNSPITSRNLDHWIVKYRKKAGCTRDFSFKDLRSKSIVNMIKANKENGREIHDVGKYAHIHTARLLAYETASSSDVDDCPAALVNISVQIPKEKKVVEINDYCSC